MEMKGFLLKNCCWYTNLSLTALAERIHGRKEELIIKNCLENKEAPPF